jgi:hypothetical protein
MKIKNLQITSATLDLDLDPCKPVCVFRGQHSELVLDLVRELIGDYSAENDPDRVDDGRFAINADIEMDGKSYSVCYIRNADFMGDNRIAANFVPNSFDYSEDDTSEFVDKCNMRDKDASNIICESFVGLSREDDRPVFIYNADRMTSAGLESIASSGRQVFIACSSSVLDIQRESLQICLADIG